MSCSQLQGANPAIQRPSSGAATALLSVLRPQLAACPRQPPSYRPASGSRLKSTSRIPANNHRKTSIPLEQPQSFFFTLITGPRRSLSLKLSDTRVYVPQMRARRDSCRSPQPESLFATGGVGDACDVLLLRRGRRHAGALSQVSRVAK